MSSEIMPSAIVPTYVRADVTFERGDGCWLTTTTGERYLDFGAGIAVNSVGHSHPRLVEALTNQGGKLWHTSNLFQMPEGERLARRLADATFADSRLLRQFGRRGQRGRDQDGAKATCDRWKPRAFRYSDVRGRFPRPHACDPGRWRPSQISRRVRSQGTGLRPDSPRRSRSGRGGDRAAIRCDHDRADSRRGRRAGRACRLSPRLARHLRQTRPGC